MLYPRNPQSEMMRKIKDVAGIKIS